MADLLNTQLFTRGVGSTDAKVAFNNLSELVVKLEEKPSSFDEGDFVYVKAEKSFYTLRILSEEPRIFTYGKAEKVGSNTNYYDMQTTLYKFLEEDNPDYSPVRLKFELGDILIVGTLTTGQLTEAYPYSRWDMYVVESHTYAFIGNMRAPDGNDGGSYTIGPPGPTGPTFVIDAEGLLADRGGYCSEELGFAFFATDEGMVYFKESANGVLPCTWSRGYPFGIGESAPVTYYCYKYSVIRPTNPGSVGVNNPPTGWEDSVEEAAAISTNGELWSTYCTFVPNTYNNLPLDMATNFVWSSPLQITGEDGVDGLEGQDAGFWIIWSDEIDADITGTPPPVKDAMGKDTMVIPAGSDWYDDVTAGDSPIWMATAQYDRKNRVWKEWRTSKIAGEHPQYTLTMFASSATMPAAPGYDVPYFDNGRVTTEKDVEYNNPGIWKATPTKVTGKRIYHTKAIVRNEAGVSNDTWTTPAEIDGEEGEDAGFVIVWSIINDVVFPPPDPNTVITNDVIGDLGSRWKDDIEEGDEVFWSAHTYFKYDSGAGVRQWTPWQMTRVAGNKGNGGAVGHSGTIIMYNTSEGLLGVNDMPLYPIDRNNPIVAPSHLATGLWKENITFGTDEARYLAVSSYISTPMHYTGYWSDWRVSRMKGEDILPEIGRIVELAWYGILEPGWSYISSFVNSGIVIDTALDKITLVGSRKEIDITLLAKYSGDLDYSSSLTHSGDNWKVYDSDESSLFVVDDPLKGLEFEFTTEPYFGSDREDIDFTLKYIKEGIADETLIKLTVASNMLDFDGDMVQGDYAILPVLRNTTLPDIYSGSDEIVVPGLEPVRVTPSSVCVVPRVGCSALKTYIFSVSFSFKYVSSELYISPRITRYPDLPFEEIEVPNRGYFDFDDNLNCLDFLDLDNIDYLDEDDVDHLAEGPLDFIPVKLDSMVVGKEVKGIGFVLKK